MPILFFLGIVIVVLAIIDIIWTILWVEGGAGFITKALSSSLWRVMSTFAHGNRKALRLAGPTMLTLTLLNWIFLLGLGWALVFSGSTNAITDTVNQTPIVWQNIVYYTGYTIFTLGLGDYSPASPFWQIMTAIASGTGMLFFTLGASYIISVVGAVLNKRSFSSSVIEIGTSSEEIVKDAWNGNDFSNMNLLLMDMSDQLSVLSMKQKAYPLLNYFHTTNKKEAIAIALPIIDDALSIIVYGMEAGTQPNPILIKKFRNCISNHLETLEATYIKSADEPLALPKLDQLKKDGLPVVKTDVFESQMAGLTERRKKLFGLLKEDNWQEKDLDL